MIGYIYEIKPYDGVASVVEARTQAMGYIVSLSLSTSQLMHDTKPTGIGYDWSNRSWDVGRARIPSEIEYIPVPGGELIVWFEGEGAIMYADSRWTRSQRERFKDLPPIILHDWKEHITDEGRLEAYRDFIDNELDWGDWEEVEPEVLLPQPLPEPGMLEELAKSFGVSIIVVGCGYALYKIGSIYLLGPFGFVLP